MRSQRHLGQATGSGSAQASGAHTSRGPHHRLTTRHSDKTAAELTLTRRPSVEQFALASADVADLEASKAVQGQVQLQPPTSVSSARLKGLDESHKPSIDRG